MLHRFKAHIDNIELPQKFTWPFHYTPHLLCRIAAQETQQYIASRTDWHDELDNGKMFGVLVVTDSYNKIGFLAAFSGNLAGKNFHEYFVPPIYDALQPGDFFKTSEAEITKINHKIECLRSSKKLHLAQSNLAAIKTEATNTLTELKEKMRHRKIMRDRKRLNGVTDESLIAESQYDKAEFRRTKKHLNDQICTSQQVVDSLMAEIDTLCSERKTRSAQLQLRLFSQYTIQNANGDTKNLCEIFAETQQHTPPAGAGECAAPKLLQYAYQNNLKPIAMAEFWWGQSPKGEIRRQGQFYPSCIGKCKPILLFMMQGLEVEQNPLESIETLSPKILWEDPYIVVVNKPSGMLSVNGKISSHSIEQWAKDRYPQATEPIIVHRLDQSTSGILVIAKDKETHKALQEQFIKRKIKKSYVALLDGIVTSSQGEINLPLKPDYNNRPCQIVADDGKKARTRYEIINIKNGKTKVRLYPFTGRTHQLRVHTAHKDGLNCPIVGDTLYGTSDTRLFLHAERIEFTHPHTLQTISIHCPASF